MLRRADLRDLAARCRLSRSTQLGGPAIPEIGLLLIGGQSAHIDLLQVARIIALRERERPKRAARDRQGARTAAARPSRRRASSGRRRAEAGILPPGPTERWHCGTLAWSQRGQRSGGGAAATGFQPRGRRRLPSRRWRLGAAAVSLALLGSRRLLLLEELDRFFHVALENGRGIGCGIVGLGIAALAAVSERVSACGPGRDRPGFARDEPAAGSRSRSRPASAAPC